MKGTLFITSLKILFRVLIPIAIGFIVYSFLRTNTFSPNNSAIQKQVSTFCIVDNLTPDDLYKRLKLTGIISRKEPISIINKLRGGTNKIIGGCYDFSNKTSPLEIIKTIESGLFIMKDFQLKPSYYIKYLDSELRLNGILRKRKDFYNEVKNNKERYIKQFGIQSESLEGHFIAKNYKLPLYFNASSLVRMLLNESISIWNEKFKKQIKDNNLNKNKVLTIASIISNEYYNPEEQKSFAKKILLDSKAGKKLELDSSLRYIIRKRGRLTEFDKETRGGYNTFREKGLPPGPIGAPTEEAIQIAIDTLVEFDK